MTKDVSPAQLHPGRTGTSPLELPAILRRDYALVLGLFLVWRLVLFAVTYAGSKLYPLADNDGFGAIGDGRRFDYWLSWAQWDGGWFLIIARHGFDLDSRAAAFLPLYPALMRLLGGPFGGELWAGLLISNLACLAFLWLLFELVRKRLGREVALATVVTFIAFPTSFFAVAVYSESLFLMLTTASLYCLRRGWLLLAAFAAGLAVVTRVVGVASWLPLALYAWRRRASYREQIGRWGVAALLAVGPLIAYCSYLQVQYGDAIYFLHQADAWHRSAAGPLETLIDFFRHPPPQLLQTIMEPAAVVLVLVVLFAGRKRLPLDWWLFSLVVALIPLSSGLLMSMPRYVLASTAMFLVLGYLLTRHAAVRWVVWPASFALQCYLVVLYFTGHWVA